MPNNDSNYILTYNHPHGQVLINELTLTDIADAIREQRLTDDRFKPVLFAEKIMGINEIEGGEYEGEIDFSVEEKDVNFYDYDGTRMYSYTKDLFLALNVLPDNPENKNFSGYLSTLIAQGWNWDLTDAQEYVEIYNKLDIGQMYDSSGTIDIIINLKEGYLNPVVKLASSTTQTVTVLFDEDMDTLAISTGSSASLSIPFTTPGQHVISIRPSYNRIKISSSVSGADILSGGGTNDQIYRDSIIEIRLGSAVEQLSNYSFKNCRCLKTITLHKDLQNIYSYNIFLNCYSLKNIVVPNNFIILSNGLNGETFLNCYSLERVILPKGLGLYSSNDIYDNFENCYSLKNIFLSEESNILSGAIFKECHSLKEINIPDSITSAENYIFQDCYSLQRINCYSTTPPSVTSTTFTGLPAYTKIYVPWSRNHTILAAYKAANNWSDIADQIYLTPLSIENTLAYAEFNSSDGSLTFFRDLPNKYTNNLVDGTKTYYTDIETRTGSSTSNAPWYSNRASVQSIIFEDIIIPKSTACWFYGMNFTSIVGLEKLNTSNVTSMYGMFYLCQNLTSLDLSYFDTSNVTNMNYMFDHCSNLTSLDLSYFNTSNVTSMGYMFRDCQNLTSLDLSHFDTSNVTSSMGHMFYNCSNLTTTFNIMNMPSNYSNMCYDAATVSGSQITLKYINPVTSADIDALVATKSSSSNVINGGLGTFVPPTPVGGVA